MKHILLYVALSGNGVTVSEAPKPYEDVFECYNDREYLIEYVRGRPIEGYQYLCIREKSPKVFVSPEMLTKEAKWM